MAEPASEHEFKPRKRDGYPWQDWMNGEKWRLKKGVDFNIKVDDMRNQCYYAAKRHDMRVITERDGDCLIVQFSSKESEGQSNVET